MNKMQMSKVQSEGKIFWMRANQNEELEQFMKNLSIKTLPNTISEIAIKNYLPNIL